jgi:hypothetical protein
MMLGETAETSSTGQEALEQTWQTELWSRVLLATQRVLQMDENGAESLACD